MVCDWGPVLGYIRLTGVFILSRERRGEAHAIRRNNTDIILYFARKNPSTQEFQELAAENKTLNCTAQKMLPDSDRFLTNQEWIYKSNRCPMIIQCFNIVARF